MAKRKRHERSLARRMAVQALYQSEITGQDILELAKSELAIPEEGPLPAYAVALLAEVQAHLGEIDGYISRASENWSISRMPLVDRAILRAAVCEMLWIEDVPVSVSINEAVELAKAFGCEDDSSRFVNGVLGRISRRDEQPLSPSEDDADGFGQNAASKASAPPDVSDTAAPCCREEAGAVAVEHSAAGA